MVGSLRYYFLFLNGSQTLNADLYSEQLQHVHENLRKHPTHINRKTLSFSLIIQSHILQELCRKKLWILVGLFYLIHYIHQILHQVISIFFFVLYKILLMGKKIFNQLTDKWQEVIQNNNEYPIDWTYSLSNYLWINNILIKIEIIYDSTQYIFVCVCVHIYIYIYIYAHTHTHVCVTVWIYKCLWVNHLYKCVCI